MGSDPTKSSFGSISPNASVKLRAFSFLIGKWDGKGKTRLPDGGTAEYPVKWVGRYILDGTAIADEAHAPMPDGSPALGITFRQFDGRRNTWIIEFLNVTGSFLRRQVNAESGAVQVKGRDVTILSSSPGFSIREHYLVPDNDHFTYVLDLSTDEGKTWIEGQIEMAFQRVE